jgi:hypothetical protein
MMLLLLLFSYVSYVYLTNLLSECDEIDWRRFGGAASLKTALDSTIWIGSKGATTPMHYDW